MKPQEKRFVLRVLIPILAAFAVVIVFALYSLDRWVYHETIPPLWVTESEEVRFARIEKLIRYFSGEPNCNDFSSGNRFNGLGGRSPFALPLYARMLDNPNENSDVVGTILCVLATIKADRSQFLERAITELANSHSGVRRCALQLLAEIGSGKDTAPIIALLSDKEWANSIEAAKTLAAIGDARTLTAMDVWLNTSAPRKDRNDAFDASFKKDIAKYRDELQARLEKEKRKSGN